MAPTRGRCKSEFSEDGDEDPRLDQFVKDSEAYKRSVDAFKRFDANGDGFISREELARVFIAMDPSVWDTDRVDKLMQAADRNGDGKINYEEFVRWLLGSDKRWDTDRGAAQLRPQMVLKKASLVTERRRTKATENCLVVEVDQTGGKWKLGAQVDSSDGKTLLITEIKKGGYFAFFNSENTARCISVGDRIVDVNGVAGDAKLLMKELSKKLLMEVTIRPSGEARVYVDQIADHYTIDNLEIASGAYSLIRKGVNKKDGKLYAIKSMHKRSSSQEHFDTMRNYWKRFDHPNITRLFDVFEDMLDYHFVTAHCAGGELLENIIRDDFFSERQAVVLMRQLLAGVGYLHSLQFCHRDIRPEHILLETAVPAIRATLKFVDFRNGKPFEAGTTFRTILAPPVYMSPECAASSVYNESVDIWSCGIIMYLMIAGYPPFVGDDDASTRGNVRRCALAFPDTWNHISQDAKDLVSQMLQKKMGDRPTAPQAITHRWIESSEQQGIDFPLHKGQQNMRNFCRQNGLKKAAVHLVAHRLHNDEISDLKHMFELLDKNGDKMVTFYELKAGLDRLGKEESMKDLWAMMEGIDVDGSQRIDYTEFLAAALDSRQYTEEKVCLAAFQVFDKDGSGRISREELLQVLEDDGVKGVLRGESLERIMKECDTDGDGGVDFKEFMRMMRGGTFVAEL